MSQPPDSQDPPDVEPEFAEPEDTESENDELDLDEPKIVEPPIDPQMDTRPLKPLQIRRTVAGDRPSPPPDHSPPATVLQEASPSPRRRLAKRLLPTDDDTGRVRLVPKVPEPPPWRVIFQVVGPTSATIGLDVRQSLVVGRADPEREQGEGADLDLTPHHALEHGISRQHAVLIPTEEGLFLADLESTNGTWVNGAYLEPGQRYLLASGDRIEFGLLRLTVRSVTPLSRSGGERDVRA